MYLARGQHLPFEQEPCHLRVLWLRHRSRSFTSARRDRSSPAKMLWIAMRQPEENALASGSRPSSNTAAIFSNEAKASARTAASMPDEERMALGAASNAPTLPISSQSDSSSIDAPGG